MKSQMNWSRFLITIGVLLALAAVAAFLTIHRPVRPASPAAMAEFTSGHG